MIPQSIVPNTPTPVQKRRMSLESINPTYLFILAAILSAIAAAAAEMQQRRSSAEVRQQLALNTELMQEMAAQSGNDSRLQELIELRQRLLETNRPTDRAAIDEILAKVPQLTADYRALQQNKTSAGAQNLATYRANWESLIRHVINEFDKRVGALIVREPSVTLTKNDPVNVVAAGQAGGGSHVVRVATFRGVELRLYCTTARPDPGDLVDGNLTITVRVPDQPNNYSNPLSLNMRMPEVTGAPADLRKRMADEAVGGINQGIADLLVVGKGRGL